MNEGIYSILEQIMNEKGLTIAEVARLCNLPDSTVRGIITRKQKSTALEVAFKLSKGLNVSLEVLNGEPENGKEPKNNIFALKIKGHSMEPRIYDGDIVIVRKQIDVEDGEIAVVRIDGENVTTKKVVKQEDGILLVGLNAAAYTPKFYSKDRIEIVGKVIEVRGKMDEWNK